MNIFLTFIFVVIKIWKLIYAFDFFLIFFYFTFMNWNLSRWIIMVQHTKLVFLIRSFLHIDCIFAVWKFGELSWVNFEIPFTLLYFHTRFIPSDQISEPQVLHYPWLFTRDLDIFFRKENCFKYTFDCNIGLTYIFVKIFFFFFYTSGGPIYISWKKKT